MMRRLPPSTPLKTGPPAAAWPAVTWARRVSRSEPPAQAAAKSWGAPLRSRGRRRSGVDAAEQGVNEAFEHFVTDPWAHHFAYGGVMGEGFVFDIDSGGQVGHARLADQTGRRDGVGLERHPEDGRRGDRTEGAIGPDKRLSAGGGDEVIAKAEFVTEFDDLRLASEKAVGGHVDGEREFGAVDKARVDLAACSRRGFEDDDVEALAASLVGGGQASDATADNHHALVHERTVPSSWTTFTISVRTSGPLPA